MQANFMNVDEKLTKLFNSKSQFLAQCGVSCGKHYILALVT